ncbi:hypothetical protein EVAR_18293_1 [Eumeta japonica]|uniref:Uncharacterized protein n=1 Tax=Eumeta variegata TaxID=151549 RepID=A0A4C1V8H1_EUMVA|nr:hypothetical protein EVAR_18293_1 [Eumeta japonica]
MKRRTGRQPAGAARAVAWLIRFSGDYAGVDDIVALEMGCVRSLSLFYSDASADEVEDRSLVPRSRSHARLRRNATTSHAFSCVQPAFIDL